jgi:demethylmenaquinone methyltransferase/2-methoxy-6-polyprenyl-1,4-benzoquinol methylase
VVGIEQSIDMLRQARCRVDAAGWGNVDLVLGSAEDVELPGPADAALFCFTHDVLRLTAAVDNVLAHLRPGGRVAAVGPMWAPWWAPGMNLLIWYCTGPYVTTYEGFEEPWSVLAERLPDLRVERQELLGRYFASGRLEAAAPS